MTFVGYYIPVSAHPARVALVITALLSLITLQLHITSNIHTAYVVSINIWMLICIGFVFLGFVEYAFAIAWIDKQNGQSVSGSIKSWSLVLRKKSQNIHEINEIFEIWKIRKNIFQQNIFQKKNFVKLWTWYDFGRR